MSPEFFSSAAAQAGELAEVISLHVLGEPLTHPSFPEIISRCSFLKLKINLVTNGLMLEKHGERLFSEKCLSQVSISLQALACLQPAERRRALEDMAGFAMAKPEGLTVGFRLRAESGSGFTGEILSALAGAFGVRAAAGAGYIKLADGVFLNFGGIFTWPGGKQDGGRKRCLGLRHHFGILSDGRVVPCCADFDGALALGNIKENSLAAILNAPSALALKAGLAGKAPMPPYCYSCGFAAFDS